MATSGNIMGVSWKNGGNPSVSVQKREPFLFHSVMTQTHTLVE